MAHALTYKVEGKSVKPAEAALLYYAELLRPRQRSIYSRTAIVELLTDLIHFCDQREWSWEQIVEEAEADFLIHVDPLEGA